MANRILHAELINRAAVPSEAEVFLTVVPAESAGVEVRARLMGPRCLHASTVEVAYHFRPVLLPTSPPALTLRAIIPEASPWSPETPHLYQGVVELWQGGQRQDSRTLSLGLRDFRIGPRGLRCNGHLLVLKGQRVPTLDEVVASGLRVKGVNLIVVPASEVTRSVWDIAARVGFAVIGEVDAGTAPGLLRDLAAQPSCLGWLLTSPAPPSLPQGALLGVPAGHPEAPAAHFVLVGPGEVVPPGKPALLAGEGAGTGPVLGYLAHSLDFSS